MNLSEASHFIDRELARISAEVGHPVAVVGVHSVEPTDDARLASVYFDLSDAHAGDAGTLIALLCAEIANDQVLAAIVARAPAHSRTAPAVEALKRLSGAD